MVFIKDSRVIAQFVHHYNYSFCHSSSSAPQRPIHRTRWKVSGIPAAFPPQFLRRFLGKHIFTVVEPPRECWDDNCLNYRRGMPSQMSVVANVCREARLESRPLRMWGKRTACFLRKRVCNAITLGICKRNTTLNKMWNDHVSWNVRAVIKIKFLSCICVLMKIPCRHDGNLIQNRVLTLLANCLQWRRKFKVILIIHMWFPCTVVS